MIRSCVLPVDCSIERHESERLEGYAVRYLGGRLASLYQRSVYPASLVRALVRGSSQRCYTSTPADLKVSKYDRFISTLSATHAPTPSYPFIARSANVTILSAAIVAVFLLAMAEIVYRQFISHFADARTHARQCAKRKCLCRW